MLQATTVVLTIRNEPETINAEKSRNGNTLFAHHSCSGSCGFQRSWTTEVSEPYFLSFFRCLLMNRDALRCYSVIDWRMLKPLEQIITCIHVEMGAVGPVVDSLVSNKTVSLRSMIESDATLELDAALRTQRCVYIATQR